jgi:hypothetical protein
MRVSAVTKRMLQGERFRDWATGTPEFSDCLRFGHFESMLLQSFTRRADGRYWLEKRGRFQVGALASTGR